MSWVTVFGPCDAAPGGPLLLEADVRGGTVYDARVKFGFAQRKVLERISSRRWSDHLFLMSHLRPDAAPIGELLFAEAVEGVSVVDAPLRAGGIRQLIARFSELSLLLANLSICFDQVGFQPPKFLLLRMREEILDFFELMTGSRYAFGFIRPGGVRWDVSEGFLSRVELWAQNFESHMQLIRSFIALLEKSTPGIQELGRLSFWKDSCDAVETSVLGRIVHMVEAMEKGVEVQKVAIRKLIPGGVLIDLDQPEGLPSDVGRSPFVVDYLGLRGGWCLAGEGTSTALSGLSLRTPSHGAEQWIAEACAGVRVDQVGLILASLDFSALEIDQ
jgi:NADH:ubiquinone oxidoreductase subunit D